jgi:hypothetical protein
MGFNRRKMEADRKAKADAEAAAKRATDSQVLEDAERLIAAWNERQAKTHARAVARPSPRVIGIYGCVVPPAGPQRLWICARTIAIATRRLRTSFRRCLAGHASRTCRSPN